MSHKRLWLVLLLASWLAACAGPPGPQSSPSPAGTPATTSGEATPRRTTQEIRPSLELVVWVAPQFAPDEQTPAGELLAARLAAFEADHPGVSVRVRVKERSGAAGLLETLSSASLVAPDVLPDLLSLDPVSLKTAALKGLVVPLEEQGGGVAEPDWYRFAEEAHQVDSNFYGLPFASQAWVLVYKPADYQPSPVSWNAILNGRGDFIFPAGDQNGVFTLAQYKALGGALTNPAGRPTLDPTILAEVLRFYGSAQSAGILPPLARNLTQPDETWQAFQEGEASSAVASLSAYLSAPASGPVSAVPLPTRNGEGISFATTWSWAIVTRDADRQLVAREFLDWLRQPEFLGPWTEALGLLPATPSSLDAWDDGPGGSLASLLVGVSLPMPDEETLATFGPPLHLAAEAVLTGGSTPDTAALTAAQSIQSP